MFNYLQSVTKKLSLGGELMAQYGPGGQMAGMTLAGRYKADAWTGTLSAAPVGVVNASYVHMLNPKTAVAADLNVDLAHSEAVATFGYQYAFTAATFRAQISSKGQVAALMEQELFPTIAFTLAGALDHASGNSSFGIGLNIHN